MTLRKLLTNVTITGASLVLGILLCELLARVVLNPADYLSVEMVQDPVLGATPSPRSRAGFDEWGFRNRKRPEQVDIVAIGDSHTYGNTATMEDSWPYVLSALTGRSVYNMGLGGYGPNQYQHLLQQALQLKPRLVLCGLYMGDDFENAFLITYGLDHWAYLRNGRAVPAEYDIWNAGARDPGAFKRLRNWLSRTSVVYQVAFHGPVMGLLHGESQIRSASRLFPDAVTLDLPDRDILEAFLPQGPLRNLDQGTESIREGMRITVELLRQMNESCGRNHVEFQVVVIPTKELVFADYLETARDLPKREVFAAVKHNELAARRSVFAALEAAGIAYVDCLPALQAAAGKRLYARTAADMHPNRNGYRVIGEAVQQRLRAGDGSSGSPGTDRTAYGPRER